MQKTNNPLKVRLKEAMKIRGIRIPALAEQTRIPKDRIYAWYRDNTSPKLDDAEILEQWLSEEKPPKNEGAGAQEAGQSGPGYVPADDLIQVLKEHNEFLRRTFESSLTGISVQAASILAHVATSLEKDDEREAAGSKEKLQLLKKDTGKRIGEKLVVGVKKDTKVEGR